MKLTANQTQFIKQAFLHNQPITETNLIPLTKAYTAFKELILQSNPTVKLHVIVRDDKVLDAVLTMSNSISKDWKKKQFSICKNALVKIKSFGIMELDCFRNDYTLCLASELKEILHVETNYIRLDHMVNEVKTQLLEGQNPLETLRTAFPELVVENIMFEILGRDFHNVLMDNGLISTFLDGSIKCESVKFSNNCHHVLFTQDHDVFDITIGSQDNLNEDGHPHIYWTTATGNYGYGFTAENLLFAILLATEQSLNDLINSTTNVPVSSSKEHILKVLGNINLESAKLIAGALDGSELNEEAMKELKHVIDELNHIVY